MRSTAVMLIMSLVLISSCISMTQSGQTTVQKQREYVVALEKKKSGLPMKYTHPVHMDAGMVREIMKGLRYISKEGLLHLSEKSEPVFQPIEIDRLAQPLAIALEQCDTSQHVRFVSLNRTKTLLLITTFQKTEGIIFRDSNSRIHFVFLTVNEMVSSDDPINLRAELSEKDPMNVAKTDVRLTSESPLFKRYTSAGGRTFPIWMTVDTRPAGKKMMPQKDVAVQKAPPMQKEPVKQLPAVTSQPVSVQQDVRNKLKYLKGLLDDGLINQDDYDARKKVLLKKLE